MLWQLLLLANDKLVLREEEETVVSGLVIFVGMSRSLDTIKFINSFGLSRRGIQYYTSPDLQQSADEGLSIPKFATERVVVVENIILDTFAIPRHIC